MQTAEVFRTLAAYESAQWRRVWQSVNTLSQDALDEALPYSHGSVRNQMQHVTEVLYRWLRGLQGDRNAIQLSLEPEMHDTLHALQSTHEGLLDELIAYVATLSDEALAQTLPGMRGPTWHVLAHLVNHGTDHRAQTLAALHQLGAPTYAQDLIFSLWFPQPPPWSKALD